MKVSNIIVIFVITSTQQGSVYENIHSMFTKESNINVRSVIIKLMRKELYTDILKVFMRAKLLVARIVTNNSQ